MTNIISNSCLGSYITRDCLKQRFINPFCWNVIDFESYKALVSNYKNIDFADARVEVATRDPLRFCVVIANKIRVIYEHYIKDDSCDKAEIRGNNVFCRDIEDYILSKYFSRIRMGAQAPVFICGSSYTMSKYTPEKLQELVFSNRDKYKLIIVVNDPVHFSKLEHLQDDTTKLFLTNIKNDNKKLAYDVFNRYSDILKTEPTGPLQPVGSDDMSHARG